MKPFRFRLARLLHLKDAEKKQRAAELAVEQGLLREREDDLGRAEVERENVQSLYGALSGRPAEARTWEGAQLALGAAKQHILRRQEAVRRAADQVEQARERLVQKAREFETLERLRLRLWREHTLEKLRFEQKENDEKAVTRFGRDAAREDKTV